jgi:serine/threonine-protein kinase
MFSPLPAAKHVAVLPFHNASGDAGWDPVASGLTETVASELARSQAAGLDFWVLANGDVAAQRVTAAKQAQQVFGVNLAVTADLKRNGPTARLHMEIVNPADGRRLVSREVVSPSSELFRLSGQAAMEAASMLDVAYRPAPDSAGGTPKTTDTYRLYETAAAALRAQNRQDVDKAIALLSQALDQDPNYALAYAKLGQAYAARWNYTRQPELIDLANRSVERAVVLNGNGVMPHLAAASLANTFRKHQQAIDESQRCLALDPAQADCLLFLAGAEDGLGRLDEAEKAYRNAIDLRPHNWLAYNRLGSFYYRHARYPEAETMFRTTIESARWNTAGYNNLAAVYLSTKRYAEAAALLKTSNGMVPNGPGLSNLGTCYFFLGRYAESAAEYEKATRLEPRRHEWWRNLGDAYAQIPESKEKAPECYRKARDLAIEQNQTAPSRDGLVFEAVYRAKLADRGGALHALEQARITNADPPLRYREAVVKELTGDRAGALKALQEALGAGFDQSQVEQTPELAGLRADPRYLKMSEK